MTTDPVSSDFDEATQVVVASRPGPVGPTSIGSASFDAQVHDGWDIMGNANGGYVMAIIGRALVAATGRPDCITVTCHYLAPCPAGPAKIDVTVIRSGRRFATASATMWREIDGSPKVIAQVLATMGDLASDQGGPTSMARGPFSIPSYGECIGFGDGVSSGAPQLHSRLATRFHPDDIGFRTGERSGRSLIRGWFAFLNGRPIDSLALLLASDAFPPAVFNLDVATNWVPTVELTVHVRAIPAPGPVQCSFETRFLQNGLLEEDGEIWDASGVLVAQSRQLALAPRA